MIAQQKQKTKEDRNQFFKSMSKHRVLPSLDSIQVFPSPIQYLQYKNQMFQKCKKNQISSFQNQSVVIDSKQQNSIPRVLNPKLKPIKNKRKIIYVQENKKLKNQLQIGPRLGLHKIQNNILNESKSNDNCVATNKSKNSQQSTKLNQQKQVLNQQKGNQQKIYNSNFHKNFIDLNPIYSQQRNDRAKRLASFWLKKIKEYLKEKVKEEMRKIFNKKIKKGEKLSYEELGMLNQTLKNDYIRHQLQEDKKVLSYVQSAKKAVEDEQNEIANLQWSIQDQRDEYHSVINKPQRTSFNKTNDQSRNRMLFLRDNDFQEVRYEDVRCQFCDDGLSCHLHQLQRRDDPFLSESQFENPEIIRNRKKVIHFIQ